MMVQKIFEILDWKFVKSFSHIRKYYSIFDFLSFFRAENQRRFSVQTRKVQSNGQYENYNNPKLNVVQDQNIKTVIGSEIEKKVPPIKETFVPLNPIANQPTFGCLKFPFFSSFFKIRFYNSR